MQKRRKYHDENHWRKHTPAGCRRNDKKQHADEQQGGKQDGGRMSVATFKVCRLRLDDSCPLSAVHAHQITQYMKNMIGVTSTRVHGQDIYVSYEPEEASDCQVKNYLCAAVCLFGSKWRAAIQRAFHHRYGENEAA